MRIFFLCRKAAEEKQGLGRIAERPWSPISPETTIQKVRKAPGAIEYEYRPPRRTEYRFAEHEHEDEDEHEHEHEQEQEHDEIRCDART